MAEGEFAKKKILITGVGGGKCLFWQLLILEVIIVFTYDFAWDYI